jgi:hypothetical protein
LHHNPKQVQGKATGAYQEAQFGCGTEGPRENPPTR